MTAFSDRPLVYIAAAYSVPDPVENTSIAIKVADELQETGLLTAYVPHLNLLWTLIHPHTARYWYSYDLAMLARCDALYRVPGRSAGADAEVIFALSELPPIPVFYDKDDLLAWAHS
jgi:hypothetical protein